MSTIAVIDASFLKPDLDGRAASTASQHGGKGCLACDADTDFSATTPAWWI
jgi:hypothetical protein